MSTDGFPIFSVGVDVDPTVDVEVGVDVGVAVAAGDGDPVRVSVGVGVADRDPDGVSVLVGVEVDVGVPVKVGDGVTESHSMMEPTPEQTASTWAPSTLATFTMARRTTTLSTLSVPSTCLLAAGFRMETE